jgi:hypothetical protein
MKNVKGTFIPMNVLTLEKLYDLKSRFQGFVNVKINSSSMNHKLINLAITKNPKNVNIGTCCCPTKRQAYIHLFRQYMDMFT